VNVDCDAASAEYRGGSACGRQHGADHSRGCVAGMLDHIRVEAYDEKMPLHTLATVLARDAQLLVASVYDPAVRTVLHVSVIYTAAGYSWLQHSCRKNDRGSVLEPDTHTGFAMLFSARLQTLPAVEKAIASSPLGLNPRIDGQEILIPVPRCVSQSQWSHKPCLVSLLSCCC
jgi:hypothetical protein